MAKSLADQLLEAGAVDKSRATKLKKQKHKQAKQRSRGAASPDALKLEAERAQREKIERDRKLSHDRQAKLDEKAIAAQVRQLMERNILDRDDGEHPYNFSDSGVVKTIFVSEQQQHALANGRIAIAQLDTAYVLIAAPVAEKIRERDPQAILVLNVAEVASSELDDEYAEYQIPDDLNW